MLSALSHAWKSWKSAPGVAFLAVVAFAVGIGGATSIFAVVNGVLLQPLPYPSGERFVSLYAVNTTAPDTHLAMSVLELHDYEQQTTSFDVIGWFRSRRYYLTVADEPQFVLGTAVTPALAQKLGPPVLGQWFVDDSGAVISSGLWQRLGHRPNIIGSTITLDGRVYSVTGVMPRAFQMPMAGTAMTAGDTDVWVALERAPSDTNRNSRGNFAYARRKPGVSLEQANADVRRVAAAIAATHPADYPNYTAGVDDLRDSSIVILTGVRATLLALLGGAALLLLIACANVATLLLARSVIRARETAIRVALGAPRRHLALHYFAEGALVSIAGAAAGVGLSAIFVRQILAAASEFIPRAETITIDWAVIGFAVSVALATGVLAGMAPLWQAFRTAPNAVLSEGIRASAAAPARRLSKVFVVAEIAFAFTLLATSAILIVHVRNLGRASLGFDSRGLIAFDLTLPRIVTPASATPFEKMDARRAGQDRLMAALRQPPGVASAAFASDLPVAPGGFGTDLTLEGQSPNASARRVFITQTTSDFFPTMGIPLRQGRLMNESDNRPDDPVSIVINETAAREFWPQRNPIGAAARFTGPKGSRLEVIGVVGDVRNNGLNRPPEPEIYVSALVAPANPINVVVRSERPVNQLIADLRRTLRQADPTLVIENVRTMDAIVRDAMQLQRLSSVVMTFFGLAALLMATLGIYGVVSYFIRQRTVELGTRMALGAVNRDLVALVLRQGLKLSLVGVALGSIALLGGVWLLVRFLEVANFGWLPFASSTAVVALVGAAAASVPAWRTTFLSPMAAIRDQPASVWRWTHQRMQRTLRDMRHAIGADHDAPDISAADVLTAFVDAARGADSYAGALRAVLASVCDELHVESAALLERRSGSADDYRCLVAAGALEAVAPVVAADGFLITRLQRYSRPLAFASGELASVADWVASHRPEREHEIRALARAGIRLAVPLRTRGEILGVLLLGERSQRPDFNAREKQVLRAGADQFALMIENARLTTRIVEQETLRRDIALASDVQRRLLPDAPPRAESVEFAASSVPARRIGGDYYDFVELRGGGIALALADVSGKGVAAALIMSVVQASLRLISSEDNVSPTRLVARMNEFVYRSTPASKYATFFYAQLDERRRQLRYVNAGHNPPYLLRAGQGSRAHAAQSEIEELSVGGTVVGMFPDMEYEEATVELCSGDVLLVFTDGVPEAHNPDDQEFGEERLQHLLRQTAHLSADEISARISAEMKDWIRDAEQYDDLTFIVMKVH